jgi:hypothetical protein
MIAVMAVLHVCCHACTMQLNHCKVQGTSRTCMALMGAAAAPLGAKGSAASTSSSSSGEMTPTPSLKQ